MNSKQKWIDGYDIVHKWSSRMTQNNKLGRRR